MPKQRNRLRLKGQRSLKNADFRPQYTHVSPSVSAVRLAEVVKDPSAGPTSSPAPGFTRSAK